MAYSERDVGPGLPPSGTEEASEGDSREADLFGDEALAPVPL